MIFVQKQKNCSFDVDLPRRYFYSFYLGKQTSNGFYLQCLHYLITIFKITTKTFLFHFFITGINTLELFFHSGATIATERSIQFKL